MSWYGQVQRKQVEGSELAERGKREEELHQGTGGSKQGVE
jgi:hypothetical protein